VPLVNAAQARWPSFAGSARREISLRLVLFRSRRD
jgi:hypothetical protein